MTRELPPPRFPDPSNAPVEYLRGPSFASETSGRRHFRHSAQCCALQNAARSAPHSHRRSRKISLGLQARNVRPGHDSSVVGRVNRGSPRPLDALQVNSIVCGSRSKVARASPHTPPPALSAFGRRRADRRCAPALIGVRCRAAWRRFHNRHAGRRGAGDG